MKIRVISLGEIITPNFSKGVVAFCQLAQSKGSKLTPQALGGIIQSNMDLINALKEGKKTEAAFIADMTEALGFEMSADEFKQAWKAMLPDFSVVKPKLEQAIAFNSQLGNQIIFISFTNPIDIGFIKQMMDANKVGCFLNLGKTVNLIAGIPLYTTYSLKQTKSDMLAQVVNELRANYPKADLAYIKGVNKIDDKTLKSDFDQTSEQLDKVTEAKGVKTIIWDKSQQKDLQAVLKDESPKLVNKLFKKL